MILEQFHRKYASKCNDIWFVYVHFIFVCVCAKPGRQNPGGKSSLIALILKRPGAIEIHCKKSGHLHSGIISEGTVKYVALDIFMYQ